MSIRHESITVQGTVVYCDRCRRRGPESAYDNIDDTLDCAEQDGWSVDGDEHVCAECLKKPKPSPAGGKKASKK